MPRTPPNPIRPFVRIFRGGSVRTSRPLPDRIARSIVTPLAWLALGIAPGAAIAAPLDPSLIHTDAAWVVHLDNEALNATTLSERVRALDVAAAEEGDREFRDSFGIDPTTDLFGLTIYGGDQGPEEGVVIVDARAQAADSLPQFLERNRLAGLTQVVDAGRTFHQWTLEGRPFVMLIASGSREDRRRVILGPSIQGVVRAARVAEGDLASQSSLREPTLPLQPSDAAILYISVRGAGSGEGGDARAALFRSARSITVEMGEKRMAPPEPKPTDANAIGAPSPDATDVASATTQPAAAPADQALPASLRVYLDIRLDAGNEQTATQLSQVAQGLASFARLQVAEENDLKQVVDMLDQVKVSVEANLVRVQASSASEAFAQLLVNPEVEAYVRSLIPIDGGVPLPGPKGAKPPATAVQPASSAPAKSTTANDEGVR